jgi:hypothetical protein
MGQLESIRELSIAQPTQKKKKQKKKKIYIKIKKYKYIIKKKF